MLGHSKLFITMISIHLLKVAAGARPARWMHGFKSAHASRCWTAGQSVCAASCWLNGKANVRNLAWTGGCVACATTIC